MDEWLSSKSWHNRVIKGGDLQCFLATECGMGLITMTKEREEVALLFPLSANREGFVQLRKGRLVFYKKSGLLLSLYFTF